MVQIIETTERHTADSPLELCVYQHIDGKTVFAHAARPARIDGNKATWPIIIRFGTPVRQAYEMAIALAEQNDITHVWINDPKGLFPPGARPAPWH
jgi:hypothetical protein